MARTVEDVLIAIRGSSEDFQDAMADARRALRRIPNTTTKEFRVATEGAQQELRKVERELRELDQTDVDADVHANVGKALADVELLKSRLDSIPRNTNVDVNMRRGILTRLGALGSGFDRLGDGIEAATAPSRTFSQSFFRIFFLIKGLSPLIASLAILLGVTLVSALAALTASLASALAGLGALIAGFAAGLGPVVAGVIAIFKRFTAIMEAREAAEKAKDAQVRESAQAEEEAAKKVEERVRREEALRDALQGRTTAERNYKLAVEQAGEAIEAAIRRQADAVQSLEDAQEALERTTVEAYRAMEDAVERVSDAVLRLRGDQLGLQRARLEIRKARQDLREFADEAGLSGNEFERFFKKITDVDFDQSQLRNVLRKATKDAGLDADEGIEFEDLALRLREAVLGEKEAVDSLGDSRRELKRAREDEAAFAEQGIQAFDPYVAALRSVEDAERSLAEATEDANKLRAQGIKGTPAVISAFESLRDAEERVEQATREMNKPLTEGLSAAQTAAQEARRKFLELSAAERDFFHALQETGDYLRGVFQPLTDSIFSALAEGLRGMPRMFGPLRSAFGELGTAMSDVIRTVFAEFARPEVANAILTLIVRSAQLVRVLGSGVFLQLFRIFLNIANIALPLLIALLGEFSGWLKRVADGTGNMETFGPVISAIVESFRVWMGLIGALLDLFAALFVAVAPFGDDLVEWITDAIKEFTKWLRTAEGQERVKEFFEQTIPAVKGLIRFLFILGKIVLQVLQFIGPIAAGFKDAFNPVLELFSDLIEVLLKIPAFVRYVIGGFFGFKAAGRLIRLVWSGLQRIPNLISKIPGAITGLLPVFGAVFSKIGGFIGGVVSRFAGVPGFFGRVIGRIAGVFKGLVKRAGELLGRVGDTIRSGFQKALDFVLDFVRPFRTAARDIFNGIVNAFKGIGNRLWTLLGGIASIFKDVINAVIDVVNKAIDGINAATPGKIEVPFAPDIPGLPEIPSIPRLASGALVQAATTAVIGEGRHSEAVLPLSRSVLSQIGKAIARHVQFPAPAMLQGKMPAYGGGAGYGGGTQSDRVVIERQEVNMPPPPSGGPIDPLYASAQFAREIKRRSR